MYILKSIQLMLCTCFDIDNYHNMLTADFYNHVVSLKVYVWEFQTCDFTENSITYIQFRRKWNKVIRISFIKYFACMLKSFCTFSQRLSPSPENDHFHKSEFWRAAAAAFFRSSFFSCNSIKSALKLLLLRLDSTSSSSSSSQMTSFLMPLLLMLSIPKNSTSNSDEFESNGRLENWRSNHSWEEEKYQIILPLGWQLFFSKDPFKMRLNQRRFTRNLLGTIFAIFKPILAIWTVTQILEQPSPETFKNHWTSDL